MDTRQFAEGYETPANHAAPEVQGRLNPEVSEIMEGPRKWTSFFDAQLVGYLKNEPLDTPANIYRELELEYSAGWIAQHLHHTVMDVRKLGYGDIEAQSAANELHFHVLNRELLPMWHKILVPELQVNFSAHELYTMQVNLSMHAAEIAQTSRKLKQEEDKQGKISGMVGVFNGQLTELDTAIVILEQIKNDALTGESRLALLPAPQQFEAGYQNKRRSSDFILIDVEARQARGIQVKTRVTSLNEEDRGQLTDGVKPAIPIRRYDNDFVTLIDGFTDLGNSRISPDRRRVISAPGLVSLDFLQHNVSIKKLNKDPAFRRNIKALMISKWIAKEHTGERTPYLNFATSHVVERILYDLYKEKSPDQREIS